MAFPSPRPLLTWLWLLAGTLPLHPGDAWADVIRPSSPPVNTETRPRGRDRRDPEPPTLPTREDRLPVVEPKRFKLLRGETLEITLDSVEDPFSQRVRFFIRDQPAAGLLSEPRESAEDFSTATVTYRSDPDSKVATDQFTFAAQYPAGRVSAAAPVVLEIIDPAPLIACVSTLDFGKTYPGTSSVRILVLTNKGTAPFEMIPELPPPWKWIPAEDQTTLRLAPGQSAPVTFGFFPEEPGDAVFRLALPTGATDKPGILFTGKGVVPFVLGSPDLALTLEPASRLRAGTVALSNPETEGVSVTVHGGSRIQAPAGNRLWLEPERREELRLVLPPEDASAFTGEVRIEANGFARVLTVHADPLPGFLALSGVAADQSIQCGQVLVGREAAFSIRLKNVGGQPLAVRASGPKPPFLLDVAPADPAPAWTLPPGAETELRLRFAPGEAGLFRDRLVLTAPGQEFALRLHGESLAPPSPPGVEATAAANLSGTIPQGMRASPQGNPTPGQAAPGSAPATDYHELLGAKTDPPASVATPAGREIIASEAPGSVTGRNGAIPLPAMISLDGLLAFSPHKLKTDVKLPRVPVFAVRETTAHSARLVWRQPQGNSEGYEVETRLTVFNGAKQRLECVWVPTKKVRFSLADGVVTAEVSGLQPESYHLFRIFTLGADGTNSLPSRELGARTKRATLSTGTIINLGVAGLVIGGGIAIFTMLRRERLL
ncbi:MAG: hypothetical protein KGS60_13415 [Verrucomicrobia bacterium]|nr:hypothetical protein [Verrucomicrobiota bacterium]